MSTQAAANPWTGFYWHVHHEILIEWCYDYQRRVRYILAQKPTEEHPLRLRLFQPVRDPPAALVEAGAVAAQAEAARAAASVVIANAHNRGIFSKTAEDVYLEAEADRDQATIRLARAITAQHRQIQALHKIECPDCPWNGKTIFAETEGGQP